MRTAKTLIRLGGCPDWFEASLGALILLVLSWGGSHVTVLDRLWIWLYQFLIIAFSSTLLQIVIWATSWQNLFMLYVSNKDADQPVHPHSLISAFVVRCLDSILSILLNPKFQDSSYRNDPKFSDTQNICCNHSKVWTMWLYHRVMSPNDADGMANSVDPDQTAPLGAVWSGSALFVQAYLSEKLGSLR